MAALRQTFRKVPVYIAAVTKLWRGYHEDHDEAGLSQSKGQNMSTNTAASAKAPLWNWKFILLILMTFLNGAAGMMTVPLVAKYAMALGAELTTASTVAGLMSMVSLVVCPFAGALADRVSRKWNQELLHISI